MTAAKETVVVTGRQATVNRHRGLATTAMTLVGMAIGAALVLRPK